MPLTCANAGLQARWAALGSHLAASHARRRRRLDPSSTGSPLWSMSLVMTATARAQTSSSINVMRGLLVFRLRTVWVGLGVPNS